MTSTKLKPLGEIATLQRGFDLPHQDRQEGQIPIISSGGRSGFHSVHKVNPPGVVTGRYGSIGEFFYIEEKFWPLNTTLWVKNFHGNCEKYVYYLLSSLNFDKFSAKTGVPGVNRNDLHKIKVPFLPIQKQKTVVQTLECWDNAIEKTEALIAAKEKQFEWLRSHLISSSKANQTLKFGDFLTESRIPDTIQDPEKRLTVRLHLKGVSVRDYRGTESTDATKYFHRKSGQLIYGKQNVFRGSIGIVPPNLDGYSSSQDIPAFDIADNVNSKWLYWYLSRPSFYSWLENFSAGSGSKRLHPKELFKISVDLPSLEDQKRISDSLNLADKEIRLLKKTLKQYRCQKRGLMQKLLTGEWQVSSSLPVAEDMYQEASA